MKTHHNTLAILGGHLAQHQSTVQLLQDAIRIMESSEATQYEVHIQQNAPGVTPIMVVGNDFLDMCYKARRLDREYNNRISARSLEVFISNGDIRIAIDPEDAFNLLPQGHRFFTFTLDDRIGGHHGSRVFRAGMNMPSAWYASEPTPDRQVVEA